MSETDYLARAKSWVKKTANLQPEHVSSAIESSSACIAKLSSQPGQEKPVKSLKAAIEYLNGVLDDLLSGADKEPSTNKATTSNVKQSKEFDASPLVADIKPNEPLPLEAKKRIVDDLVGKGLIQMGIAKPLKQAS